MRFSLQDDVQPYRMMNHLKASLGIGRLLRVMVMNDQHRDYDLWIRNADAVDHVEDFWLENSKDEDVVFVFIKAKSQKSVQTMALTATLVPCEWRKDVIA